jgi:hypothetical protein
MKIYNVYCYFVVKPKRFFKDDTETIHHDKRIIIACSEGGAIKKYEKLYLNYDREDEYRSFEFGSCKIIDILFVPKESLTTTYNELKANVPAYDFLKYIKYERM